MADAIGSQLTSRPDSVFSKCRRLLHPIPARFGIAFDEIMLLTTCGTPMPGRAK